MIVAKQVADLLTWFRAFISLAFLWLGLSQGSAGLSLTIVMLIASWTSDTLDGPLARSSRVQYQSWIGEHDLEIDMMVSIGVLGYLVFADFIHPIVGISYLMIWVLYFWRRGFPRSMAMLFQAPCYGTFIFIAMRYSPAVGWWLIVWLLVVLFVTWPKFPQEVVPGFLAGMRDEFRGTQDNR